MNTEQISKNIFTYCLSVFDHFVKLALKGLKILGKLSLQSPQKLFQVQLKT